MEYKAAIYCRLSQDDGSVGESGSIQTQKTLLTQYCKDNHINVVDCYCDDGWSGTNFDRPEFKRMLDDIETGRINMVIVKDLSRFGREYAQMGLYIEHYFEEKEVRFISVAENIDSLNGIDSIALPITNVMNSFYARQSSAKTKAAHRARAKNGMFLGSRAPYGYQKDPNERHHLIIDPVAADIVRRIFTLFAQGVGYVRMTKILRQESIPNPQAYFNQNNPDYYKSDYWRKPFDWHATSVRAILNNPVYLGQTTFGRTKTKGFFDKTRVATPEDEWIVVEGTHEPIITQELWDSAHRLMESRRRECSGTGEVQMFSGLVKCADCGSSLNVSYSKQKGKYTGFSCWVYKNYGKERCTSHAIGWQTLNQLVLQDIRRHAFLASEYADEYLEALLRQGEAQQKQELVKYRKQVRSAEKRLAELDRIIERLFEDHALGSISDERYHSMMMRYEEESCQQKEKKNEAETILNQSELVHNNARKYIDLIRKYTEVQELDAHILNELIDRIVVHEKALCPDGQKSQRVDIHYRFVGMVKVM